MDVSDIILASSNQGKIREFQSFFQEFNFNLKTQSDFDIVAPEETGVTFIENALSKARHVCEQTQLPTIADDSGLVVPALGGSPGVYSARYGGEHGDFEKNMSCLLQDLIDVRGDDRYAYFCCVLALLEHPQDPNPIVVTGVWEGLIAEERQGDQGFGYDPIFFDPANNCTAAQMDLVQKNENSHRAQALEALRPWLH